MNIHIDADGGLVSNPSDREIQGTSDFATRAAALVSDVSTLSWNEPRIAKRDIGHLSNMKLIDPSTSELSIPAYIGKTTGRDWMILEFVFVYLFRSVIRIVVWGSSLVDLCELILPAVGMGTKEYVPLWVKGT